MQTLEDAQHIEHELTKRIGILHVKTDIQEEAAIVIHTVTPESVVSLINRLGYPATEMDNDIIKKTYEEILQGIEQH